MPNAKYVTTGKPKIGGAVFAAPFGTPLPTSAVAELNSAFKELGYCSSEGLTNGLSKSSTDVKAWGGDTVGALTTEKSDTFKLKFIESMNIDTLKFIFGEENVHQTEGSDDFDLSITLADNPAQSLVIDLMLADGAVKRIVVYNCKLSELGEVAYKDEEATGYDATIKAFQHSNGEYQHEYFHFPTTSGGGSGEGDEDEDGDA